VSNSVAVNQPSVQAEVEAAVLRYEEALVCNDVAVLDDLFWDSDHTVRYGATECIYGGEEIRAFRRNRPSTGLDRQIHRLAITTFGDNFAVAKSWFRFSWDRPNTSLPRDFRARPTASPLGIVVGSAHVGAYRAGSARLSVWRDFATDYGVLA
jgi:hypothetical protein